MSWFDMPRCCVMYRWLVHGLWEMSEDIQRRQLDSRPCEVFHGQVAFDAYCS